MSSTETEIDFMLKSRATLNVKTKTNYKNYYIRMRALLENDIIKTDNDDIITAIKNATNIPVSVKQSLLNICIVIKQVYNLSVEELIKYRSIGKEDILEATLEKNKQLKEELPKIKTLIDYTDELYDKGLWRNYIVNYLLLTFGVRNMDLNLTITKEASEVNNKDNWLVVRKTSIRYMRYVFKTADTYECKDNEIKSQRFIHAVEEYLGGEEKKYLLLTTKGERIDENNLNKYIIRMTYKQLGQSKYFKILVVSNKKDLDQLSVNRGTAKKTIEQNYDLEFKNVEGKAKKTDGFKKCKSKIPSGETAEEKKERKKKEKENELTKAHEFLKSS